MNNLYRDLWRLLKGLNSVEPTYVKIPVRTRKGIVKMMLWPILAPHELVFNLASRGVLNDFMLGSISQQEFWEKFKLEPGFQKMCEYFGPDIGEVLALRLHGDEGILHNMKGVMVFSIGGLKHSQDVYKSRLLLTVIPGTKYTYGKRKLAAYKRGRNKVTVKARQLKFNRTLEAVSQFLFESFACLAEGRFGTTPFTNSEFTQLGEKMQGKPLMRAALVGIKGDWKFEKEFFQQGRGWSSKCICVWCDASVDHVTPFVDQLMYIICFDA